MNLSMCGKGGTNARQLSIQNDFIDNSEFTRVFCFVFWSLQTHAFNIF